MTNILLGIILLVLAIHIHQTRRYHMALSARAQAIIDRINAINTHVADDIAGVEAAHDAANAAATDADDTAIEGALATLEGSLGAPAGTSNPSGDPLPPAEPV